MNTKDKSQNPALDDIVLVDVFVRALIKDAQSPSPALSWEPSPRKTKKGKSTYVAKGFPGSNSKIVVTLDEVSDAQDHYTLTLHKAGEIVMQMQELSLLTSSSDLRQLYTLVTSESGNHINEVETVNGFNPETDERLVLDRILDGDFPTTTPILVGDVFRSANASKVVEAYMKRLGQNQYNVEQGAREAKRIRNLAMSTISILRHTRRAPTQTTFTGQAAPIHQIANYWTTWHEVFPADTQDRKEMINGTAVSLLTSIIKER